jgi:hypothetical protein
LKCAASHFEVARKSLGGSMGAVRKAGPLCGVFDKSYEAAAKERGRAPMSFTRDTSLTHWEGMPPGPCRMANPIDVT